MFTSASSGSTSISTSGSVACSAEERPHQGTFGCTTGTTTMRLVHLARGLGRLGRRDQVRLAAAWSLLGLSRLAILVLPFSAGRRALGEQRAPVAPAEDPGPALDGEALLRAR